MMKSLLLITAQVLLLGLITLYFRNFVFAGDFEGYSGVVGTVAPTICGDGIVGGVEQCEPTVGLINNSCTQLGYDKGTLTCDPSCSFNVSACEYIPPTPQIPPFPGVFPQEEIPNIPELITLPFFLIPYDLDNDGEVDQSEYCGGLTYWLKKWKIRLLDSQPEGDIVRIAKNPDTCDLNFDKNCNLIDFSIFLSNSN